jgi:hypothetical protein
MKILYVYGDDDFAALTWEQKNDKFKKNIVKKLKKDGDCFEFEEGCFVVLKEFGDIDKKFIEFLGDSILDYDQCKNNNFYEIGD